MSICPKFIVAVVWSGVVWAFGGTYAAADIGCLLALIGNGRYPPGTLVEGNCGFDFSIGVPADAPNCPRTVPIALVLVPKCASVSFLNWIAMLDGTAPRLAQIVDEFEAASHKLCVFMSECPVEQDPKEQVVNSIKLISHITNGEPPRGMQGELSTVDGMMEIYVRFSKWAREGLLPYPQNCVHCCSGKGRIPVAVVRNPFARLMAYFQRAWLQNPGKAHSSMDFFPLWVEALQAVHGAGGFAGALRRGEDVTVGLYGRKITFDVQDLYHTQPAYDLLASLFPVELALDFRVVLPSCPLAECWYRRSIFVIRTEKIVEDLNLLKVRLCLELGYCQPLPHVLHLNLRSSGQREDALTFWSSSYGEPAAQRLRAMYAKDFLLGCYGANASDVAPSHPRTSEVQAFVTALERVRG